jgi:hypothetical protein
VVDASCAHQYAELPLLRRLLLLLLLGRAAALEGYESSH